MPRPRQRAHQHAVAQAGDPRPRSPRSRRFSRGPAPANADAPRRGHTRASGAATPRNIALPPGRSNRRAHLPLAADRHVLHDRPLQPKQPRPYPDTGHVASLPRESSRRDRKPEDRAACAPSSAAHPTHGVWLVNPSDCGSASEHAEASRPLAGPVTAARLSAGAGLLLDRRGRMYRRQEPPRDESGFRAHGSNQQFRRLQRHTDLRAQKAPSLSGVSSTARRFSLLRGDGASRQRH